MLLPDLGLVRPEFALHVADQLLEVALVVQDELADDRFVDLNGGKLVLGVFHDDRRELGEVFGDLRRAICHYENILGAELVEELSVAVDAGEKGLGPPFGYVTGLLFLAGCRFLLLLWLLLGKYLGGLAILFLSLAAARLGDQELWVGARASLIQVGSVQTALLPGCGDGDSDLGPESEFVLGALLQTFGDELDAGDDFFEENLEDRVRPREPSTHVPTRRQ